VIYEYTLERAEMYIVPEPMLKNRTCQSYRWKQVALSDDLEALKELMGNSHRIVNRDLKTIVQTYSR
jgi:hypothetical protein